MSPLDDELRSLLHARADVLSPAPDPLSGIERRAKRMRRNRVAASVAGTALAVAAIAVAVPALVPDRGGSSSVAVTPEPSAQPSTSAASTGPLPAGALDAQHPWEYRGDKTVIADLTSLQAEWATVHPGATLTPLYGEIYESSKKPQITFVSTGGGGERWGVATSSEAGWTLLHDEELAFGTKVLMAALPADETPRLLIVAAPSVGQISYAAHGTDFRDYPGPTNGVVYVPLSGDTSGDVVRVLDGNGNIDAPLFEGPAPDAATTTAPTTAPSAGPSAHPANYLPWQTRGTVDPRLESQAVMAYARAKGAAFSDVGHEVLWAGKDKAGRGLLFMQAWVGSGSAQTFGFVSTGEPFLGPVIGPDPVVLAYVASAAPGQTTDTLVLLPRPGDGPFSYASSSTAPYRVVGNARSDLGNVAVLDRDPRATSDRVQVLAGDGMQVLFRGPLMPLLCGATSCG